MDEEKIKPEVADNQESAAVTRPKSPWFKNKKVLLIVSAVCLVVASGAAFVLLNKKPDSKTPVTSEHAPEVITENIPIQKVSVEGVPGIKFSIPKNWTAINAKPYGTLTLYTDDAEATGEPYVDITKGNSLRITPVDRDKATEAGKSDPLDAHINSIGAPRNTDNHNYEVETVDLSKFKKFTNKHGIKMMAYPWAYEGCYEDVIFLGERLTYSVAIFDGDKCPTNEILTSNSKIKAFLDSIEFVDGTPTLEFVGAYINHDEEAKAGIVSQVHVPGVAFGFQGRPLLNQYYLLSEKPLLGRFNSEDKFEKILIGSPRSAMEDGFNCQGCGSLYLKYDEALAYSKASVSTDGYDKLTDSIYGKKETTNPVQDKAEAVTLKYIKILPAGSFTYTVTLEVLKETNSQSVTSIDLKNEVLIKMIESIIIL